MGHGSSKPRILLLYYSCWRGPGKFHGRMYPAMFLPRSDVVRRRTRHNRVVQSDGIIQAERKSRKKNGSNIKRDHCRLLLLRYLHIKNETRSFNPARSSVPRGCTDSSVLLTAASSLLLH